jgi:uncharacterized protein YodC (DUF2158 family)
MKVPRLRPGNLVRHKTGGPIMMVTRTYPHHSMMWRIRYQCTWVEGNQKTVADF